MSNRTASFESTTFRFGLPSGWFHQPDSRPALFHGPQGAELIVSSSKINGDGSDDQRRDLLRRVLENAEKSMLEAASHPDLRVTKAMQRSTTAQGQISRLDAVTRDGSVQFVQISVAHQVTVILFTFEAPVGAAAAFAGFLTSVESLVWV